MGKLLYGVGINDAGYTTVKREKYIAKDGRKRARAIWRCGYFRRWTSMIERCFSEKYLSQFPTYRDVSVCNEWLTFSNFLKWMKEQENKLGDLSKLQLDKDILCDGDKIYSPETCCFVHEKVNYFIRGGLKESTSGCSFHKASGMIQAKCGDPINGGEHYLGLFSDKESAREAWLRKKNEIAHILADSEFVQEDRVRVALRKVYQPKRT